MALRWLPREAQENWIEYFKDNVFCPDFQEQYTCYLQKPPVWSKQEKKLCSCITTVYIGEYEFSDGLIIQHCIYDVPIQFQEKKDDPQQEHSMCIVKTPGIGCTVEFSTGDHLEIKRGPRPYDASYADRITQVH